MVPEGLDPAMPLSAMGFDSLMAVQLRNQIERDLGVVVPLIRVLQAPSVEELVPVVLAGLETTGESGRPVEGASAETWEEGSV
jgi:acyl carrier protein